MKYLLALTLGIVLLVSTGLCSIIYPFFSEYLITFWPHHLFFYHLEGLLVSGNDEKAGGDDIKLDATIKAGTGTDADTLKKEEEAINIDGLNTKQVKELRDKVRHLLCGNTTTLFHLWCRWIKSLIVGPRKWFWNLTLLLFLPSLSRVVYDNRLRSILSKPRSTVWWNSSSTRCTKTKKSSCEN